MNLFGAKKPKPSAKTSSENVSSQIQEIQKSLDTLEKRSVPRMAHWPAPGPLGSPRGLARRQTRVMSICNSLDPAHGRAGRSMWSSSSKTRRKRLARS